MNHIPFYFVSTGHPMVLINGVVAFNAHKIVRGGQVSIEIRCRNHNFFVFGKATGGFFHNRESFWQYFQQYFFEFLRNIFFNGVDFIPHRLSFFELNLLHSGF